MSILALIEATPLSKNVQIFYLIKDSVKVVDRGDSFPSAKPKITKKELNGQFRTGCGWVSINSPRGVSGFVRTPDGKVYKVNSSNRLAKLINN